MRIFDFIRTADDLRRHIFKDQTIESEFLDFKALVELSDRSDNKYIDIATDIVAFANNLGGNLIVGISEKKNENGIKTAHEYVGLESFEEYRRFIESNLKIWIYPTSLQYFANYIEIENKKVISINIYPLENHIGAVFKAGQNEIRYPFRTTYGNRFLSPSEVEERVMNDGRKAKLAILKAWNGSRIDLKIHSHVAPQNQDSIFNRRDNGATYISEVRDEDFLISFNGVFVEPIPYSFVKDFWKLGGNGYGIVLKCTLMLFENPNRVEINFRY